MRLIWMALGLLSLALGGVGTLLPLLPTVPFLLLAAFFFARSSDRLHDWLLGHRVFGPPIADWRRNGAIRRPVKWISTASIAAALAASVAAGFGPFVLLAQGCVLSATLVFIWSRPEPVQPDRESS